MEHWNQKVAANRGKSWRNSLLSGRLEANLRPSAIRLARIKKTLSQSDVAKSLSLTYATYGAIETGKRTVKEERARKISELLGLNFKKAFTSIGEGKFVASKLEGK